MRPSQVWALVFWVHILVLIVIEELYFVPAMNAAAYRIGTMLIGVAVIFGWFLADAKERNHDPSRMLKVMVIAFAIIAVPYYRFRYFGTRNGFIFLGSIVAAFFGLLVVGTILFLVVSYAGAT